MKRRIVEVLRALTAAVRWPFWYVAIFVGLMIVGLTLIARNWDGTQRTLAELRAADSDNLTWNLTQLEVDYLALVQSLFISQVSPANTAHALEEVRLQFDILYSRVELLQSSYVAGRSSIQGASFRVVFDISQVLQDAIDAIDGDDAGLAAEVAPLLAQLQTFQRPIRHLSVQGVQVIDAATARRRAELADAIREFARISVLMIGFIATVAVFVIGLAYLLRQKTVALTVMGKNLAMIQDVAFDAILVIDDKGLIVSMNASAERMFRMPRDAAIGRELPALFMRDAGARWLREGLADYLSKGVSPIIGRLVALSMHDSLGNDVPVEGAFTAGNNVDGSRFVVAFLRDVRERLAAESEINRALVSARIGEETKRRVLSVLGHELRTALNGVVGSISLLANPGSDQLNRQSLLNSARITALDALRIANNALESSSLDAADINSIRKGHYVLRQLMEQIASQHSELVEFFGARLKVNLDPSTDRRILGDEHLVSLATGHLLNNAIRFSRNGEVELSIIVLPSPNDGAIAKINVRDTGCGIDQIEHSRIFEDFENLNEDNSRGVGGVGLGLGIVARAVKLLGGEISLKSSLHEGSDFCICYPVKFAETTPSPSVVRPLDKSKPLAVLIVDDNAINREVLRASLSLLGVSVFEAEDGQQAVEMSSHVEYDVILMDLAMPRLGGLEATRLIRSSGQSRHAVIVGLTAQVRPEDQFELIRAGMQEVLMKPLSQTALERVLGRSSDERVNPETKNDTLVELVQSLGALRVRNLLAQFESEARLMLSDPAPDCAARAHSIAGAAALFGFNDLRARFLELETLCETGNEGVEKCIVETRAVLAHTIDVGVQLISGMP